MSAVYLIGFIAGLLLAVRIMFFGAERRRARPVDGMPLRRSEPAISAFLVMFGVAGYLLTRPGRLSAAVGAGAALGLGILWAALVTRLAIATARVQPEHDPDDPRFVLQGHVAMVTSDIPADGEGTIVVGEAEGRRSLGARSIDGQPIDAGLEVCIERVENGIAFVEPWAVVEARL
jgi:membrane protein implicated in regulation of membrane protease activity